MKKILITGGAGFIGSNLAETYIKNGFQVALLDNFSSGKKEFIHKECIVFQGNICDKPFVENVFKTFQPQIVSHHAAHISIRDSLKNSFFDAEQNILGALNIFDFAGKNQVKNIVFASTGGAMIPTSCDIFPSPEQEGNLVLESPYAISKFCAEKYLRFFEKKYEFCATIFRYANVYGPRQTPKGEAGVISIFLAQLLAQKIPIIFGDGNQTRDFLFIEDLLSAHLLATKKNFSGTFHLGVGNETSLLDLYKIITKLLGENRTPSFEKARSGELLRSCLDSSKFQKISGWAPQVSLENGIAKTIDWWKKQPLPKETLKKS